MRRGQADHVGAVPGGLYADGRVGVEDVAVLFVGLPNPVQGPGIIDGRGLEIAGKGRQLLLGYAHTPGTVHFREQGAHRRRVFTDEKIQVALEIGGDLDVHGRAQGRVDLARRVAAIGDEPGQDVIAVGGDEEPIDGQSHALGHVAGEDVAEVAGGDRKADPEPGVAPTHPPPGVEVVDDLGQDAGPINGVDRAEVVLPLEIQVVEQGLDDALAIVEGAADGDVVDVRVRHRGHLPLLDRRDPARGMQDEDPDTRLAAHTGDGRRTRIPRGRPQDIQPAAVTGEQVFEDIAEKLQRHVLESGRGAVEQLQDPLVPDLHQRRHLSVGEGPIGAADQGAQVGPWNGVGNEGVHELQGQVLEAQAGPVA